MSSKEEKEESFFEKYAIFIWPTLAIGLLLLFWLYKQTTFKNTGEALSGILTKN